MVGYVLKGILKRKLLNANKKVQMVWVVETKRKRARSDPSYIPSTMDWFRRDVIPSDQVVISLLVPSQDG